MSDAPAKSAAPKPAATVKTADTSSDDRPLEAKSVVGDVPTLAEAKKSDYERQTTSAEREVADKGTVDVTLDSGTKVSAPAHMADGLH